MSGLADADYADGRMVSALARFRRCVELCDAHGLTRVAIPNLVMVGFCRFFLLEFDEGIADIEAARALAVRIGDRYGEMFTLESPGLAAGVLRSLCRGRAAARARARARRGDRRAAVPGDAARGAGRDARSRWDASNEARERIERALALFARDRHALLGPDGARPQGAVAGRRARARARSRGGRGAARARLRRATITIGYHRIGIDDALARGEWPRGLAHAAALEAYTAAEPLPYADFLIARARVLVGLASRPADPSARTRSSRGCAPRPQRVRWPIGWPARRTFPARRRSASRRHGEATRHGWPSAAHCARSFASR